MIRTFPRPFAGADRAGSLLLGLLLGVAAAIALSLVAVLAAFAIAPPGVSLNLGRDATDVPLDSAVRVLPQGWAARVDSASLVETLVDLERGPAAPRDVPLQLEVLRAGWWPGQTEVALRPAEGSLRPDAGYRLAIRGTAYALTLPWPQLAPFEREAYFTTPPSPRPLPMAEAARLRWEEPLAIQWSVPIEDLQYEIMPPASTRSSISLADRRTSHIAIDNPQEGTTYKITVTDARGSNGVALQRPATYAAVTPLRPRLEHSHDTLDVEIGKPAAIRWNVPIERLKYEISPNVESTWLRGSGDPSVTELRLEGLEQGSTYELTFLEAVSRDGAPLAEPATIALETPQKLMVEDLETGTTAARASVNARPTIVFAEPIRDRGVAEAAVTVEPSLPGRFEWLDARQLRFIPSRALPYDTTITFRIKPGPDGPRSVAGGYFERPAVMSFRTEVDKIIDVNVSRQVLTLIEQNRAVASFPVATGVIGADTPLGEFYVDYKMPVARFRGTNPTGSRYDIPDVKWVLSFLGDYTIHGAYWRSGFGAPGSNGCVSLSDANAKVVYDWAPEGTLVKIHY